MDDLIVMLKIMSNCITNPDHFSDMSMLYGRIGPNIKVNFTKGESSSFFKLENALLANMYSRSNNSFSNFSSYDDFKKNLEIYSIIESQNLQIFSK